MKATWLLIAAIAVMLTLTASCEKAKSPAESPAAPEQAPKLVAAPEGGATTEPEIVPEPAPENPPAPARDLTRIQVDVKTKTVTVEGRFCLAQGILDYLAVVSGGHEYESILALNCKASRLHAFLLGLGATPGLTDDILERLKKNPPEGDKVPAKGGTKFSVTVEWERDGKTVSVSATKLLINRKTQKEAEDAPWSFTGSYFAKNPDTGKDVYMGDMDEDLLAVFWAPSAVMNFERDNGNAYDATNTGYEVNTAVVPKPGTPCKVTLKMIEPAPEPAK